MITTPREQVRISVEDFFKMLHVKAKFHLLPLLRLNRSATHTNRRSESGVLSRKSFSKQISSFIYLFIYLFTFWSSLWWLTTRPTLSQLFCRKMGDSFQSGEVSVEMVMAHVRSLPLMARARLRLKAGPRTLSVKVLPGARESRAAHTWSL